MMKLKVLFCIITLLSSSLFAANFVTPDILVDSKLNYDWSNVLIKKFRKLLKNFQMKDPFSLHYSQPLLLNESSLGDLLPDKSKSFSHDLGKAIGLDFIKTKTEVWMHGFNYDVKGFKTDLRTSEHQIDGLMVDAEFSASEVFLNAEKMSLNLVIPDKPEGTLIKFEIINPTIKTSYHAIINFLAKIKIKDNQDSYKFIIQQANFDKMATGLINKADEIKIHYDRILIPKTSLRVGSKTINFYPERIEKLIRDNQVAIKGFLLSQMADLLRSHTTQSAFRVLEQYKLSKEYWIPSSALQSQFLIHTFRSTNGKNNIEIDMPGDFCTNEKFFQMKSLCVKDKKTKTSSSRLRIHHYMKSLNEINEVFENGEANIVVSVSEDYVNKLLVTTYDAGLWKESLDEAGVELGPNKVIMRLDQKGQTGTLAMDVVYKPTKIEKLLTGTQIIRFPLVLEVSLRIEKIDDESVVIIRLNDVDSTDATLIYGREDLKMYSTLKTIPRFKTKVANTIRERLNVLRDKDIIELRYPELNGLGLEKVNFHSDGSGRMNATMRLEDLLE
jgi:hypothetical protein